MYPNSRKEIQVGPAENSSHPEAWLFAQEILGRPIPRPPSAAAARRDREQLEWLASISDRHAAECRAYEGLKPRHVISARCWNGLPQSPIATPMSCGGSRRRKPKPATATRSDSATAMVHL